MEQDFTEAAKWYRKAADQENPGALYNLGQMYRKGEGVEQDHTEAVKWYRKAAEQGHLNAQHNLAVMYCDGLGVQQDYKGAAKWYRKAAEQGDSYAQNELGRMYLQGLGVKQDYKEAANWHQKAIDQGDMQGHKGLGDISFMRGVWEKAEEHYKLVAEQDYGQLYLWAVRIQQHKNAAATEGLAVHHALRQATDENQWVGNLIAYCTGGLDENSLLQAAQDEDKKKEQGNLCEAYFFIAYKRLAAGKPAEAAAFLRKCVATKAEDYLEYDFAKAELQRLKRQE